MTTTNIVTLAVTILVPFAGGIVWLGRLEGKVNTVEARYQDILNWLQRIEAKLDRFEVHHGHPSD